MANSKFDVIVVGAGVFGSWSAYFLQRAGRKVLLLDAYGPASSRASSGGESRIIRMGYGPDELYTKWSQRSLPLWKEMQERSGVTLFHRTGVLWMAREGDEYAAAVVEVLKRCGIHAEQMDSGELARRYPQMRFEAGTWGILETESGALMARRGVQTVAAEFVKLGGEYRTEVVKAPSGGRVREIETASGARYSAESFVFAAGSWLPKVFPELLGDRIFVTRQEVFFFGVPAGVSDFAPPKMPTFLDRVEAFYGIPDLENRGLKVADDDHGAKADPDTQERAPTEGAVKKAREYLGRRFPSMKDAPLVEARVCQYENSSNGDFLIDRHPEFENVCLVGGGSGHGFKHGPALGEYVARMVSGNGKVEERFSLRTKEKVQKREIF
jgi:monomeric sarcosine oxidase